MTAVWAILYRGPLSSCNYGCEYCPFAKRSHTRAELAEDAACLERFVDWVANRGEQIGILFTPWGEALVHRYYQEAIAKLSHLPNVVKVAAQTNLSYGLDWLEQCNTHTTALWCSYHPTESTRERFLRQSRRLSQLGIRHSVGIVGRKEALPEIEALRSSLPPEVYLWVNAWKRESPYYSQEEVSEILRIDPLFGFNILPQPSLDRACHAGHRSFTVDGAGDVHRCHFIADTLGNIYDGSFDAALKPRACSRSECRCHIGYIHMPHLGLGETYGAGLLERIPANWPTASSSQA